MLLTAGKAVSKLAEGASSFGEPKMVFNAKTGERPPDYPEFIWGQGAPSKSCLYCRNNKGCMCDAALDKKQVLAVTPCKTCHTRGQACLYGRVKYPPYLLGFASHPVPGFEYLEKIQMPHPCEGCRGAKQKTVKCSMHPPPGGCIECVCSGKQCLYRNQATPNDAIGDALAHSR